MFRPEYEIETHEVKLTGRTLVVSILHHHALLADDPENLRPKLIAAHQQLAADFHANPHSANQLSACIIDDVLPVKHRITPEAGEAYFAEVKKEDVRTQQYYYQLFGKPTFQIYVVESGGGEEFNRRIRQVNQSANQVMFATSLEQAIVDAANLLKIAHRL